MATDSHDDDRGSVFKTDPITAEDAAEWLRGVDEHKKGDPLRVDAMRIALNAAYRKGAKAALNLLSNEINGLDCLIGDD
ncbi:MAG: hypothetical protein IT477_10980 [Rhodanobacteraceae bacterium]|nr:hypothetical protein [Rhodanobacteraceae bacterium]